VSIDTVLAELKERVDKGLKADYITLSGSGEPTLNSQIGILIDGIKKITDIPIAIITNGTLLGDSNVRSDCKKADVVLPSLDAGDAEVFQRINRPHTDLKFDAFVEGLCRFRAAFTGQIWLEVFFIEGINTDDEQVQKMKAIIERIAPDKVQLNTAVRPTTDSSVGRVGEAKLKTIAKKLGGNAEVVADFSKVIDTEDVQPGSNAILEMLKRRPCSLDDICCGLRMHRNEVLKYLGHLEEAGFIESQEREGENFFKQKLL